MRLFAFGLGYVAKRLAAELIADGWRVAGTTRSGGGDTAGLPIALHAHGPDRALDPDNADLRQATHILMSAPPGEAGDPVLPALAQAIKAAPDMAWIGYLSTTGVYGDRHGGEVDETSELRPTGLRGRRRKHRAWVGLLVGLAATVALVVLLRREDGPVPIGPSPMLSEQGFEIVGPPESIEVERGRNGPVLRHRGLGKRVSLDEPGASDAVARLLSHGVPPGQTHEQS